MARSRTVFALAAILIAAGTHSASAVVFDLASQWSDAANPNGPWTYREGANPLGHVDNWTPLGVPGAIQPAWSPPGGAVISPPGVPPFIPAWFKATSAQHDWQVGDIVVHTTDPTSGAGEGIANVLFTSPSGGHARISGRLWNARTCADIEACTLDRPQGWELAINGITVASGGDLLGDGSVPRSDPITFDIKNRKLAIDDTVDLFIFEIGGPSNFGDFVGVSLSIKLVPEPTSFMLLGSALLGLSVAARCRGPTVR